MSQCCRGNCAALQCHPAVRGFLLGLCLPQDQAVAYMHSTLRLHSAFLLTGQEDSKANAEGMYAPLQNNNPLTCHCIQGWLCPEVLRVPWPFQDQN